MTTLTILLIEDDPDFSTLLRHYLAQLPLSVSLYLERTLAGALRFLAGRTPDLVIADLGLPDSQGAATLEALPATLPLLVVTSNESEDLMWEAVYRGVKDYLLKQTLTPHALTAAVFTCCGLLNA